MKMDPFSTHQALLTAAMVATNGDIFEMGGGWYSTPLVNIFSKQPDRRAWTIETKGFVRDTLARFHGEHHKVALIEGLEEYRKQTVAANGSPDIVGCKKIQSDFLNRFWGDYRQLERVLSVVFVDQAPGFNRAPAIEFFADKAEYIITHDTEHAEHYQFEPVLSSFRYRWDFNVHEPNSTIVSNVHSCDGFSFLKGEVPATASNDSQS